jgi:hypothetical protein
MVAVAMPAMADSWKCESKAGKAQWKLQISHSRTPGEGRVPAFLLVHNGKKDGAIVRTDDQRRITLGSKSEPGTSYTVKLNGAEKNLLEDLADQRLTLKGAERVTLWVNFELNEEGLKENQRRKGTLTVTDADKKEVYDTSLKCVYDTVQD